MNGAVGVVLWNKTSGPRFWHYVSFWESQTRVSDSHDNHFIPFGTHLKLFNRFKISISDHAAHNVFIQIFSPLISLALSGKCAPKRAEWARLNFIACLTLTNYTAKKFPDPNFQLLWKIFKMFWLVAKATESPTHTDETNELISKNHSFWFFCRRTSLLRVFT